MPALREGFDVDCLCAALEMLFDDKDVSQLFCIFAERDVVREVVKSGEKYKEKVLWGGTSREVGSPEAFLRAVVGVRYDEFSIISVDTEMNLEELVSEGSDPLIENSILLSECKEYDFYLRHHALQNISSAMPRYGLPGRMIRKDIDVLLRVSFEFERFWGISSSVSHSEAVKGINYHLPEMLKLSRWSRFYRSIIPSIESGSMKTSSCWSSWVQEIKALNEVAKNISIIDFERAQSEDLVRVFKWYSALYFSIGSVLTSYNVNNLAFAYIFRSLDYFVDSQLALSEDLKIGQVRGKPCFTLNEKKVLGFGSKWEVFKGNTQGKIIGERLDELQVFLEMRNLIDVTHGDILVSSKCPDIFKSKVFGMIDSLEHQRPDRLPVRSLISDFDGIFGVNYQQMICEAYFGL